MDPQGTRFLAPPDGWKNKTFIVIYPHRGSGMRLVLQCACNKISRIFDDAISELVELIVLVRGKVIKWLLVSAGEEIIVPCLSKDI